MTKEQVKRAKLLARIDELCRVKEVSKDEEVIRIARDKIKSLQEELDNL